MNRFAQLAARKTAFIATTGAVSLYMATEVEKSTHQLFFWAAPHWYADVDEAYGISQEQLASVRHLSRHNTHIRATASLYSDLQPSTEVPEKVASMTTAPVRTTQPESMAASIRTNYGKDTETIFVMGNSEVMACSIES